MQKNFTYSGVFKPYSDVLKPYSGVFMEIESLKLDFYKSRLKNSSFVLKLEF